MFESAIEVLEREVEDLVYKRDYPSWTAIAKGEYLDSKITELEQAIMVLKKAALLNDLFKDAIVVKKAGE